jgi:hypothetical protein
VQRVPLAPAELVFYDLGTLRDAERVDHRATGAAFGTHTKTPPLFRAAASP